MTEPLVRPKRKDPLKRTRLPLSPPGARSRTALGLAAAAAQGRFAPVWALRAAGPVVRPR